MPWRGLSDGHSLEHLGADECWGLLGRHGFGRVCFWSDDRVHVAMTPFVARPPRIYFRAVAFGSVARRVLTRPVTLQADDMHHDRQATWAVTATGSAQHVRDASTLASLWTPVRPEPWDVGQGSLWIELTPDDVQGQRLRPWPPGSPHVIVAQN